MKRAQKKLKRTQGLMPHTTDIGDIHYYAVFEPEYAEEGSTPYRASSKGEAIRLHARATATDDELYEALEITPVQYAALMREKGAGQ